MIVKRIIHTRPDGGVTINSLAPQFVDEVGEVRRDGRLLSWLLGMRRRPSRVPDSPLVPLSQATIDRLILLMASPATDEDVAVEVCKAKDLPDDALDVVAVDGDDVGDAVIRWSDGTVLTRRFRSCCRRTGTALPRVDMPLARVQRMNEVRAERAPKLVTSDIDWLKAQEAADVVKTAALKTYRQALRDLPATSKPAVDACTTPEALDAWAPTWPTNPT